MEEREIPLDLYPNLDVLGMERPDWQKADQPEPAEPAEPVRFTQKEMYLIVLICGGFLYFSGLGVWLTNREVQEQAVTTNPAETYRPPADISQPAIPAAEPTATSDWSMESHQALIDAYGDQARLSAIDAQLARKYDALYQLQEKEKFKTQVLPPPNWALLRGSWSSIPLSH